jgi:probable rRNA maturation factor
MRALNRRYRGVDRTTDVLSFSMLPPVVLGDVVISAPTALAQAKARGRGLEDELITLLAHGVLHLAGYDHEAGGPEARKMRRREEALFRLLRGR